MKRETLITQLGQYLPQDKDEQSYKKQFVQFVRQYPNCFERSLDIGHVTASAWILDKDRTHALLLHHQKLDRWLQLGGHTDGNPDVLAVSIQEAKEESGLSHISVLQKTIFDLDIHLIPARKEEKAHFHYDVRFLLEADRGEALSQNHESKAVEWVTLPEVSDKVGGEASILRMLNKSIKII